MIRSRTFGLAAATTAGAAIAITLSLSTAQAGHLNAVLETDLSGRAEVNTSGSNAIVGDPNGRGEAYVFGIDGDAATLCYVLTADKIDETFVAGTTGMAHIHRGAAGTNGPVVANLAWPQDGQAGDCLTDGEAGKFMNGGSVQEILRNPTGFYVNIHNSVYPAGAIRGQLDYSTVEAVE